MYDFEIIGLFALQVYNYFTLVDVYHKGCIHMPLYNDISLHVQACGGREGGLLKYPIFCDVSQI